MNTLNAPRPQKFHPDNLANEKVTPQDPWAETPRAQGEHSGDLAPLPHMSPQQEANAFDGIVHEFKGTEVVTHVNVFGNAVEPAEHPTDNYAPRHRRLNEEPFTATPMSDIERRNKASLQATLALRETLRKTGPELFAEAKGVTPGPATEKITLPAPEQPAMEQPIPTERPASYRSRHRLLGRFARLFRR